MMHQQPDGRREWDLYDPDALKKDKPARVHDDDPRLTISGKRVKYIKNMKNCIA